MRDCEDYQLLISRMLDDDLSGEERGELAEHVKRCPDCAAVYVAFRSLSEQLDEEPEPVPAGLHENIMAAVRRSGLRSISPEKRRQKRWRALLATAACFVVIAAAGLSLPRLLAPKGSTGDSVRADEPAAAYGFAAARSNAAPAAEPEMAMEYEESLEAPMVMADEAPVEKYAGVARRNAEGDLLLDGDLAAALEEKLTQEQAVPQESSLRELPVALTTDGTTRRLTLLLGEKEAFYVGGDGDRYYRIDSSPEELLALLGLS